MSVTEAIIRRREAASLRHRHRMDNDPEYRENRRLRSKSDQVKYKEYFTEYSREYREKNKERFKVWKAKSDAKNRHKTHLKYKAAKQKNPALFVFRAAKRRAKTSGIEFSLTRDWFENRWTGVCEVTGIPFQYADKKPNAFSPSIDRVDSSAGYVEGNCRFVLWALNRFKNTDSDDIMLIVARAIVENGDKLILTDERRETPPAHEGQR